MNFLSDELDRMLKVLAPMEVTEIPQNLQPYLLKVA